MKYDLAEWATKARQATGMTQEDFSLALGYSTKASVNAIEKGRNNPTFEVMVKMSELSGIPLPYQESSSTAVSPSGMVRFEHLNVVASMGSGSENSEFVEVVNYVSVAEKWAREHLGSNLKDIRVITAKGDSMAPTIQPNSVLFVDSAVTFFDGEGIYIVQTSDGLKAKRLQMLITGGIHIISDNPQYRLETVSAEDLEAVRICGKVRGSWALNEFK